MWIKNNEDIERFTKTINECEAPVIVVTDEGEEYNLKNSREYYLGLANMLATDKNEEPEIFAYSKRDQGLLIGYLHNQQPQPQFC